MRPVKWKCPSCKATTTPAPASQAEPASGQSAAQSRRELYEEAFSETAELRQQLARYTAKDRCLPDGFDISDDCSAELAIKLVETERQLAAASEALRKLIARVEKLPKRFHTELEWPELIEARAALPAAPAKEKS